MSRRYSCMPINKDFLLGFEAQEYHCKINAV